MSAQQQPRLDQPSVLCLSDFQCTVHTHACMHAAGNLAFPPNLTWHANVTCDASGCMQGSLWLGFGPLGVAGAISVSALSVALHCLLLPLVAPYLPAALKRKWGGSSLPGANATAHASAAKAQDEGSHHRPKTTSAPVTAPAADDEGSAADDAKAKKDD